MTNESNDLLSKIVSLCKRRGFVFPGSEIYGGLAGTWDYGPLGVALKENVKRLWWERFVTNREDMYGVEAAILMNQNVWKASGHVGGFFDPLVECKKCKHRFRADQLSGEDGKCPDCDGVLSKPRQFNMMFKTSVGSVESEESASYLRPETAQGMFVNFKNIFDTFHPKLPFGLAQIGKAFRNEIAPRDFLFRSREFEQMEIEYFVHPSLWRDAFEAFQKETHAFLKDVGIDSARVHELEVPDGERAHYSKRTIDFEYDYPFGRKELYGLAYRTDFDLKNHSKASGVELFYLDEETKERFVPHCIEPSFGIDRTILAILSTAYAEDEMSGGPSSKAGLATGQGKRVFLKLSPRIAPVKVAVFPLLKNKPVLVEKARGVYATLKKEFGAVMFDDNGNIGKRYRRQDEIGTPFCVTVDFDSLEKNDVTVRDRDTGKQDRVKTEDLTTRIMSVL